MWRVGGKPEVNGGTFLLCVGESLKVDAGKSNMIVMNGEEGL